MGEGDDNQSNQNATNVAANKPIKREEDGPVGEIEIGEGLYWIVTG